MKNYLKTQRILYIMLATLFAGTVFYACKKSQEDAVDNTETLIYKKTMSATSSSKAVGQNVNEVFSISYNSGRLEGIKKSDDWKSILKEYEADLKGVKRVTIVSSDVEMFKIPLISRRKNEKNLSLLVYALDGKYVFSKVSETRTEEGNNQLKFSSLKNELYFQLDLNNENKIGNAKIATTMPFKQSFDLEKISASNKINSLGGAGIQNVKPDCLETAADDWWDCMNCLIIEKCGSSWLCAVACGADVVICVGAAGIACITVKSNQS